MLIIIIIIIEHQSKNRLVARRTSLSWGKSR